MNKLMIACASALMMMASVPAFAADATQSSTPQQTETKSCEKGKEGKCKKGEGKCKKGEGKRKKGEGKKGKDKGHKGNGSAAKAMKGGRTKVSPKQVLSTLNLTADQTKKVDALCTEQQTKMEARRAERAKKAEKERSSEAKKVEKEMKSFESKLEKILTPEQFASFKAKMAEEKAAAKEAAKKDERRLKGEFKGEFKGNRKSDAAKAQLSKEGISEVKECPVQQPM